MTPARASESTAVPKLDPGGILTRTLAPPDEPPHAMTAASDAITTARPRSRLTRKGKRMLQQDRRGNGIDISLASARGSTHLAHGAKSGCGSEPLVNETHRKAGSFLQLGGNVADLGGAWSVVAVLVEWQTHDEALRLELGAAADHLCDGRAFPGTTDDEAGWGGDRSGWVANRETDTLVAIVDS